MTEHQKLELRAVIKKIALPSILTCQDQIDIYHSYLKADKKKQFEILREIQ